MQNTNCNYICVDIFWEILLYILPFSVCEGMPKDTNLVADSSNNTIKLTIEN